MELDEEVRMAAARGERIPQDDFTVQRFRQPVLNEGKLKPSLYRHGKTMLPESVYGKAARGSFRRASMSGGRPRSNSEMGFVEAGNGGKLFIVSPLAQTGMNPLHMHEPSAHGAPNNNLNDYDYADADDEEEKEEVVEGDDHDEFEEEDVDHRDLDAAVDALLEDENKKTAVNTVSAQISAMRRSSVMGVAPTVSVPGFRRNSNADAMSPDSTTMRVHTFTSRDLDEMNEVEKEERQVSKQV